jgi:osmotically-inducible protein OsmY
MYERQQQQIRVVHSPSFRGFGPHGYLRSDARITEDVLEELQEHEHIDETEIRVCVVDGEVTLTGTVPDEKMSRIVVAATERLRGVRSVHNLLAVFPMRA